jgi:hypothetical protein
MDLSISNQDLGMVFLLLIWIWSWKGVALWKASRLSHKWWFVAFVALNLYTFGILEIFYIFLVASKYKVEATEIPAEAEPTASTDDGQAE